MNAHWRRERNKRSKKNRLGSKSPSPAPNDLPLPSRSTEAPRSPSFYDDDPVPISYEDDDDALDATHGPVTPDAFDGGNDLEDDRSLNSYPIKLASMIAR